MKKAFLFVLFGITLSLLSHSSTAFAASVVENYSTKASDTWIDFEIQITKGYSLGVNVSCTDPSKKTTYATASRVENTDIKFRARCTSLTPETTYTYAIYASDGVSFPTRNDSTKTLSKSDLVIKPEVYKLEQATTVTQDSGVYTTSSKVSITNPVELVGYRLALGKPKNKGCTFLPEYRAEQRPDKASVENKFLIINGSWKPTEGTYCLGLEKETGVSTRVFTTAVESLEVFTVGGKVVTAPNPNTPNENGCTEDSTDQYCAIAVLPGVGEADAQGRYTGKISLSECYIDGVKVVDLDGKSGFGCYLNNILRLFMGIIIILSVVMLIFSGIEAMTSQNGEKKVTWKGRMRGAILGLVLALSAYMLLNTVNKKLVNLGITLPSPVLKYNEEDLTDVIPTSKLPPTPVDPKIKVPTGTAQSLAADILKNPRIRLNNRNVVKRQNDFQSSPRGNIEDVAAGKIPWTSTIPGKPAVQVPIDARVLAGLIAVSQVEQLVIITEILGGQHGDNSPHYRGGAFDIQTDPADSPDSLPRAKRMGDACRAAGAAYVITPCGGQYGIYKICPLTGHATNDSHATHVHCQW